MFGKAAVQKWFSGCFGLDEPSTELHQDNIIPPRINTASNASETLFIPEGIATRSESVIDSPVSSHTLSAGCSDCDTDETIMSSESNDIPPKRINGVLTRDYALLGFDYYMSDKMKERGQAWMSRSPVPVLLDTPMNELARFCDIECKMTRMVNNNFMLALKEEGKGVSMKASIEFQDERDLYANKNIEGKCRIDTIRNLFTTVKMKNAKERGSPLRIPIAVEVSLTDEYGPEPVSDPRPNYKFNRIGRSMVQRQKMSAQKPPIESLFLVKNDTLHERSWFRAHERSIDGLNIGSLAVPIHHEDFGSEEYGMMYPGVADAVMRNEWRAALLEAFKTDVVMREAGVVDSAIAALPPLDFDEEAAPKNVIDDSNPVYLAIRIVNHLATLSLDHIALPANVRMTLSGPANGKAMLEKMDLELWAALAAATSGLCRPAEEVEEWHIRWWVRPQGMELGKMYKYESGSIKKYLDPEMVKAEKRELYAEAHLVPNDREHRAAGTPLTPTDSEVSGESDMDDSRDCAGSDHHL